MRRMRPPSSLVLLWLAVADRGAAGARSDKADRRTTTRASSCSPTTTSTATSADHTGRSRRAAASERDHDRMDCRAPSRQAASSTSRRTCKDAARDEHEHVHRRRRGDLIGASPLISGALPRRADDRGASTCSGSTYNGVGNHEFDEGIDRAAADAERRLSPGRRLPGRRRRSPARRSSFLAANVDVRGERTRRSSRRTRSRSSTAASRSRSSA